MAGLMHDEGSTRSLMGTLVRKLFELWGFLDFGLFFFFLGGGLGRATNARARASMGAGVFGGRGKGEGLLTGLVLLLRVCVVGFSVWGRGEVAGFDTRGEGKAGSGVVGFGALGVREGGRMADVRQERADALEGLGVDAGGDGW